MLKDPHEQERIQKILDKFDLNLVFHEQLRPYLSLYTFERGESICRQGEQAELLYVLVEGRIKIFNTTEEGKALIVSFKQPLEVIGDIEYVQGIDIYNTVEAVSRVTMLGISHKWLSRYGSEHPPLLNFLLKIVTHKFYLKNHAMSLNLMHPVEVRLASYLLSSSYEHPEQQITEQEQLIPFYPVDTANLIGTSYRHLNRVIHKFVEEGLIARHKDGILIKKKEALQKIAGNNIYENQFN